MRGAYGDCKTAGGIAFRHIAAGRSFVPIDCKTSTLELHMQLSRTEGVALAVTAFALPFLSLVWGL